LRALRRKGILGGKRIFVCDQVYGDFQTGNMHPAYTLRLLDRLSGRVNEIYFHPGSDYARKLPGDEQSDTVRDVELQALLDPAVKAKIEMLNLHLMTYTQAETAILSPK